MCYACWMSGEFSKEWYDELVVNWDEDDQETNGKDWERSWWNVE